MNDTDDVVFSSIILIGCPTSRRRRTTKGPV